MTGVLSWWNRRQFLKGTGLFSSSSLLGNILFAASDGPIGSQANGARKNIYERLGVQPLINAVGPTSMLGGGLMPREVIEAMEEATHHYVSILELQEAVGKRIAAIVGAEAAIVTAGASAALTLGTAACVTGADPDRIKRLPDTAGMKNEVIIQKAHRFDYDHAIRSAGVKLIEIETSAQLENAINEKTAMMFYLSRSVQSGKVPQKEFVEIAKKAGIPTLIDAASDLPPAERLYEFQRLGFDLVAFSGGKALRGPQCSGVLFGRRDLVNAALLNGFPHPDTIGRTCKVGKEEIVGFLTALELYLKRDHKAEWQEWEERTRFLAQALSDLKGVRTEMMTPDFENALPRGLIVRWDEKVIPLKHGDVAKMLKEGNPRIEVRPLSAGRPILVIAVYMLRTGEHKTVANRVREILKKASLA